MGFFSEAQAADLSITRMVFHLVGPSPDNFIRLEEIHPGKFTSFFLDRIRSVGGGAPYIFSDASSTRERLKRIADDPRVFQDESERLAEDFQRQHAGTTAAGAFLVFILDALDSQFFALLKYDDEIVLTYEVTDAAEGRKRATLDTLERTFVQNRNALQKAALVRLSEDGGELSVVDRRSPHKVARYFENFLDAVRVYGDAELTEMLVRVTRDVIRSNAAMVPPEVFSQVTKRTYDAAAAGRALGPDEAQTFLEAVLGQPLPDEHPLLPKFNRALRTARLDGIPMLLDAAKVSRPNTKRLVTINNIQIRIPVDVEDFVDIQPERIVINDRLASQYDDAELAR